MRTAAEELFRECCWVVMETMRKEHGWVTSESGNQYDETDINGEFINTMMKELAWVLQPELFALMMEAKAQALRAEADILDGVVGKYWRVNDKN